MKTVKAKVLSSKPIRISKAASILSKFASAENGASQAVGAYLRRASEAFNELAQLHREIKSSSSSSSSRSHRKKRSDYETEPRPEKLSREQSRDGGEIERKRHKKKSAEKAEFVNSFNGEEGELGSRAVDATPVHNNGVDVNIEGEGGKKKKHKKRRKENGDVGISEENGKVETVVKFETNDVEANERKKKRKSVEVEEGVEIGSEEQRSKKKKKKKRKIGDEDN